MWRAAAIALLVVPAPAAASDFAILAFAVRPQAIEQGDRARMSVELNDDARVVFTFARRGSAGWVPVRSVRRELRAGQHFVTVPRRLSPARYRITATAWSDGGQRAAPLWTFLRIR